ncbi:MAG TPA: type II toxin-antitoxin system HigB family toxin [Tepidisphaeraceae bacterium]|jgi:mRNA interferase HigB|nr:type II toxin-antitoxin system HigB family toxin [Tepidisphaeraceae bacterium]
MTLIGQDVISRAGRRNKPLQSWLAQWAAIVAQARWQSIDDLRNAYPSADGVRLASGTAVTVFNVKGNQYRLLAWIDYSAQTVEALEVITHAEYNKDFWKARY